MNKNLVKNEIENFLTESSFWRFHTLFLWFFSSDSWSGVNDGFSFFRFELLLRFFWNEWGNPHVLRLFFHMYDLEMCKRFTSVTFGTFFRRLTIAFEVIEWRKERWMGGMWGNVPYSVLGLWRTGSPDSSFSSETGPGGCGIDETSCWSLWLHSLAIDRGTGLYGCALPSTWGWGITAPCCANCLSHSCAFAATCCRMLCTCE